MGEQHLQTCLWHAFRMGVIRTSLMLTVLLVSVLSGCLSVEENTLETTDPESIDCTDSSTVEWSVTCPFPPFELADADGNNHSVLSANGTGRWIAYVSAYWCTHCQPTLDALDRAVEPGRLLVMNKDPTDDNMSAWKAHMEEEINRTLNRPFLHAPNVTNLLGVEGVPHVVLVDNLTIVAVRVGLWDNPERVEQWFHSEQPVSGYSSQLE